MSKIKIFNNDFMKVAKNYKDNHFDWICIDPPYGLGNRLSDGGGKLKHTPMAELYREKDWDVLPTKEQFNELFRISKNQIVFGANYFLDYLPATRGFVVWDKKQAMPTLSAVELIWTSLDKPAKIMRYSSMDLNRFHPTQKPIKVYKFMFEYCKIEKGQTIFDGYLGSGSLAIACYDYDINLVACEIDTEYYNAAMKRLKIAQSQTKLF